MVCRGFGISPYFDQPFYVGYEIGGFELGLDPSPETYTSGNHSVAYWKTDDIEAAFEKLKSLNVQIQEDIHSVGEGILVGTIFDPFGNLIGLIEEA